MGTNMPLNDNTIISQIDVECKNFCGGHMPMPNHCPRGTYGPSRRPISRRRSQVTPSAISPTATQIPTWTRALCAK